VLSQSNKAGKLSEKKRVLALPELVPPRHVRLKFCKVGKLQYISHLDLQTTFNRIINRACLPVWYTKGFNPHIKLVFSTPLSVGTESVCEYLDIRIDREMSCEEIKDRLNAEMTDEFYITEAYIPESDFSEIAWASYEITLKTNNANAELAENAKKLLTTSPLILVKKTKSGEKEMDIIPQIRRAAVGYDADDDCIRMAAELSATTDNFLNPELLMTALIQHCGIMQGDPMKEYYTIIRRRILTGDGKDFR
jgi:radical SAM-linked protein